MTAHHGMQIEHLSLSINELSKLIGYTCPQKMTQTIELSLKEYIEHIDHSELSLPYMEA